jgi:hypothetical protein
VWFSGVDLGTLGAIEVLCAVIVIIGAIVIFTLRRETIGSVLVIAFSVIGFIALGSSVIFNIFGIIGGALGLAKR